MALILLITIISIQIITSDEFLHSFDQRKYDYYNQREENEKEA